jgi:septum formation protein
MNNCLLQGPFQPLKNIILASASPRRQRLLTSLGLHFEVRPASFQEPSPDNGEEAENYALRMAESKVKIILKQRSDSVVIGSDTVVVLQNEILGKPENSEDALRTLSRLSGQTHRVVTACSLFDPEGKEFKSFSVSTSVVMANWDLSILEAYAQSGEALDKAGSYAIQDRGGFLVESIQGSHSNVIGLPLKETVEALLSIQAISIRTE